MKEEHMLSTAPVTATAESLNGLVSLARSPHLFLSVYLSFPTGDRATDGLRLLLATKLNGVAERVAGTALEAPFQQERPRVEGYVRSLRPGGPGLALLSSPEAKASYALWLPRPVADHARFGRGAYVLPVLDLLDELDTIGFARVSRDKALLMVVAAGRVEETLSLASDVPGKHKKGPGAAPRYSNPVLARQSGGGVADRYERHLDVHIAEHHQRAVQALEALDHRMPFRRLYLAGPSEPLAQFKSHLTRRLQDKLAGDLAVSARSGPERIRAQLLEAVQGAEHQKAVALIQDLITRAAKGQGAVAGMADTLFALARKRLHLLAMAGGMSQPGRSCLECALLLAPEATACPQCGRGTMKVDLWEELPGAALSQGVPLRVVHGEAASLLWHYDGIGGLLKPPAPH